MRAIRFAPPYPSSQRGVSLIAVLMVLVIVTMLGLSAMQISSMSERGARSDRDTQIAVQAAQAALVDAEYDMRGPGASIRLGTFARGNLMDFEAGCGSDRNRKGLCLPTSSGKPAWLGVDFTVTADSANTAALGDFTGRTFQTASSNAATGVMPARKPRYVIEAIPDQAQGTVLDAQANDQRYVYRVTALGFGPRPDIQVVLQMLYRKE